MKNSFATIGFLLQVSLLNAQQINNLGVTERYQGSGHIDEYQVEIIIDIIERPLYENTDLVGVIQQFSANYHYTRFKQEIRLVGTRKVYFSRREEVEKAPLVLHELDEDFNKVAEFSGIFNKNSYKGKWTRNDHKRQYNFEINFDEDSFTELRIKASDGYVILPNYHINKFNQNKYDVIKIIERSNKTYVLTKLHLTTCGALKGRGSGCGGHDQILRLHEITGNEIKILEVVLEGYTEGYTGGHVFHLFSGDAVNKDRYSAKVVCFNKGKESIKLFEVDFNSIEAGIREVAY